MPHFLTDANFNRAIVRGLLRRKPDLDVVLAQDLGFERTLDPDLLEWAAREQRVLITHDVRTMPGFAYARMRAGKPVPGVIEVDDQAPIGRVIDDILLLIEGIDEDEWENRIHFVPLIAVPRRDGKLVYWLSGTAAHSEANCTAPRCAPAATGALPRARHAERDQARHHRRSFAFVRGSIPARGNHVRFRSHRPAQHLHHRPRRSRQDDAGGRPAQAGQYLPCP